MKFKLKLLGPNRTEIRIGNHIIFFSYETPVAAFWANSPFDTDWIRTAKRYSVTTSKHIGQWLGGCGVTVLPDDQFQAVLALIMSTDGQDAVQILKLLRVSSDHEHR